MIFRAKVSTSVITSFKSALKLLTGYKRNQYCSEFINVCENLEPNR
jgi:hypothetical protein